MPNFHVKFQKFNAICRLIGLSVVTHKNNKYAASALWICYSSVVFILYMGICVMAMRSSAPKGHGNMGETVEFVTNALLLFDETIRIVFSVIYQKKFAAVLNCIEDFERTMEKFRVRFSHGLTKVFVAQILLGALLISGRVAISYLLEPDASMFLRIAFLAAFVMQYVGCCQFCNYLLYLGEL